MKKLKKLWCRLFGHEEFMCDGCQRQIMAIFEQELTNVAWECRTPGCQEVCRRCGASTR